MRPRELLSTGVPRWTIHTETFRSDKSDRALKDLQELAVIAEQATPLAGNRLELCLRTRSNQVVLPSVEAALLRLKATVGELREKQQFIVTSKVMFPLDSLRTLAFSLPNQPRAPHVSKAALRLAPNLDFLQLYVSTHNSTVSALGFLTVLAELPKVTSLRLVTNGNAACLLPSYLMHITRLELGHQVHFRQVPLKLHELCLEGFDLDYLGYDVMMFALQQVITPVDMTLSSSAIAAVPFLPENLLKLSLEFLLAAHYGEKECLHTLHTGMARLVILRVLCVADFLTELLVSFMSGMVFPNLHTLGFCLDSQANTGYYSVGRAHDSSILQATIEASKLMTVFPNLQHMKVSCVGLDARTVRFDCAWFRWTFLKLRSITCYSAHVNVEFLNLKKGVCLVYKS